MGRPKWVEIIKHFKLSGKSSFSCQDPPEITQKWPFRFYPFKSTRLKVSSCNKVDRKLSRKLIESWFKSTRLSLPASDLHQLSSAVSVFQR